MALVVTDAIDPGPPQTADGIAPVAVADSSTPGGRRTLKSKQLTLTFSGTYATGGYTLSLAQMAGLKCLFAAGSHTSGHLIMPVYNADGTLTVKLFWRAADSAVFGEVPNGTAIAFVSRLLVLGREA